MKVNITVATPALVSEIWDVVEPFIKKSLKRDIYLDADLIKQRLIDDKALIFLATIDGKLSAAVVVEIWEGKSRFVNIMALGGENFKAWQGPMSAALEEYARESGCERLVTNGRAAWARLFPKLKPFMTCFTWELNHAF